MCDKNCNCQKARVNCPVCEIPAYWLYEDNAFPCVIEDNDTDQTTETSEDVNVYSCRECGLEFNVTIQTITTYIKQ